MHRRLEQALDWLADQSAPGLLAAFLAALAVLLALIVLIVR